LLGDERIYYFPISRVIKDLLVDIFFLDFSNIYFYINSIVAEGFYVPGTSIVLSPIRIFTDNVSIVRFYIGFINYVLLYSIYLRLIKTYSHKIALISLILFLLYPSAALFSFSIWGEGLAGKLIVLLFLHMSKDIKNINSLSITKIGGLLIAIVFIRHSYIFITLFTILIISVCYTIKSDFKEIKNYFIKVTSITLVVSTAIFLWSFSVSQKYGCCFFTTTTLAIGPTNRIASDEYKKKLIGEDLRPSTLKQLHEAIVKIADKSQYTYATIAYDLKNKFTRTQEYLDTSKTLNRDGIINCYKHRLTIIVWYRNTLINKMNSDINYSSSSIELKDMIFKFLISFEKLIFYLFSIGLLFSLIFIFPSSTKFLDLSIMLRLFILACILQIVIRYGVFRYLYGIFPLLSIYITVFLYKIRTLKIADYKISQEDSSLKYSFINYSIQLSIALFILFKLLNL